MAWRRPGDKPLSELMVINLLAHIFITRPQWVKQEANSEFCESMCLESVERKLIKNDTITMANYVCVCVCFCVCVWLEFIPWQLSIFTDCRHLKNSLFNATVQKACLLINWPTDEVSFIFFSKLNWKKKKLSFSVFTQVQLGIFCVFIASFCAFQNFELLIWFPLIHSSPFKATKMKPD